MQTQRGNSIVSLTSALDTGGWSTPHSGLFTTGEWTDTHFTGGWLDHKTYVENFTPTEMRSLERPVRSQSLYWLCNLGPWQWYILVIIPWGERLLASIWVQVQKDYTSQTMYQVMKSFQQRFMKPFPRKTTVYSGRNALWHRGIWKIVCGVVDLHSEQWIVPLLLLPLKNYRKNQYGNHQHHSQNCVRPYLTTRGAWRWRHFCQRL